MLNFAFKRLRIGRFHLQDPQIAQIAEAARKAEAERIAGAVNVSDQPAKPLKSSYAKAKVTRGAKPIRNLRSTGAMLDSRRVLNSGDGKATVAFADPRQGAKAATNERRESMLGLSPADRRKVDATTEAEVKQSVKAMALK